MSLDNYITEMTRAKAAMKDPEVLECVTELVRELIENPGQGMTELGVLDKALEHWKLREVES